jgi:hypothetical protein
MRIVRYGAWPFHNLFNLSRRATGIKLYASAVPNSREVDYHRYNELIIDSQHKPTRASNLVPTYTNNTATSSPCINLPHICSETKTRCRTQLFPVSKADIMSAKMYPL